LRKPENGIGQIEEAGAHHEDGFFSRRGFLGAIAAAGIISLVPAPLWAAVKSPGKISRTIELYSLHSKEHLKATYYKNGRYQPRAMQELNRFLRDHRTGGVRAIDKKLLDLVHTLWQLSGSHEPIHVVCGYRSPLTNKMLQGRRRGVARKSLHMEGKAADIYIPGCGTKRLQKIAVRLKRGGVGYYPRPDFVHVDTGKVRYW
jgi:uncharacterized protein YcbK (DUF882 family)